MEIFKMGSGRMDLRMENRFVNMQMEPVTMVISKTASLRVNVKQLKAAFNIRGLMLTAKNKEKEN